MPPAPPLPSHVTEADAAEVGIEEAASGLRAEGASSQDRREAQADSQALRQRLVDLLDNAVKDGLPGRWVEIETDEIGSGRSRQVRIRIHGRERARPAEEMQPIL